MDACRGGVRNTASLPPGATLDLSFMIPGTLDPRITFTRASTATYTDATGTMQTANNDTPRWDYDPVSLQLRGMLLEDARTNLLLNSATLGTQSVAVTAQAYTLSFYGTGTITKSGTATGALAGTGQRVTQTFTPTAGTLTLTVTGSVLNAQLEASNFATSWISTAGAAVTRNIDSCTIPSANMGFFTGSPGGSWYAELDYFALAPANTRVIARPGVNGSIAPCAFNSSRAAFQLDGVGLASANVSAANTITKCVSTWAPGQAKICLNGGAVASSTTLVTGYAFAASGIGLMSMATALSTDNTSGHIRRVSYWPRVLADAEMQQVTT